MVILQHLTWIKVNVIVSRYSRSLLGRNCQPPVAHVALVGDRVEKEELAQFIAVIREGDHATVHGTVVGRYRVLRIVVDVGLPFRSSDLFNQHVLFRHQCRCRIVCGFCNVPGKRT